MAIPTIEQLFSNYVHLGHKKEHSDPRYQKYIFSIRDGIYIIDLEKTQTQIEEAIKFLNQVIKDKKTILFVGTKNSAKEICKKVASDHGMPYIDSRWLGGTLTNFETILANIKRMNNAKALIESDEFKKLPKKEQIGIKKDLEKMQKSFEGIKDLKKLPDCLFVVDAAYEKNAVAEANKLNIPIVAICDSNSDPIKITVPVPANDEAKLSVELVVKTINDGLIK